MIGSRVRRAVLTGLLTLGVSLAGLVVATPAHAVVPPAQGWGEAYNLARPGCLDTGTSTNAFMRSCTGTGREYWTWNWKGKIYNGTIDGCLDDGAGLVGSRVAVRTCTPTDHQIWYAGSTGQLINLGSGLCLDADLGTLNQSTTIVQVWSCSGQPNQAWWFQFTQ